MRTYADLRRRLEDAAAKTGHSLAREVERRLERSFDRQELLTEILDLAYGKQKAQVLLAVANEEHNLYWEVKALIWQLQRDGKLFEADLNAPPPTDEEFDRMVAASELHRKKTNR